MKRAALLYLVLATVGFGNVLDAIAHVESGGRHNAVGDSGKARGAWQMHRAAWDDAASRLRAEWTHAEAHDATKARAIAAEHLRWLNAQFTRRTGRQPTTADSYALWNLGVGGYARRGWDLAKCPAITRRAVLKMDAYLGNNR
jgi:hypothetical protein